MSSQQHLIQLLLQTFNDDNAEAQNEVYELLQKYSTEWIQPHHIIEKMDGVIDKFDIHGQSNKYDAIKTCMNYYYKQTQNYNKDENYLHIIHLLLEISQQPLKYNMDIKFRNLSAIIKQMKSNKIENDGNEDEISLALLLKRKSSQQLAEWRYELEQCPDDLSEQWTDDEILNDDMMKCESMLMDPTILKIRTDENQEEEESEEEEEQEKKEYINEQLLYIEQVTQFDALISALMGIDSIYFKWRRVEFVFNINNSEYLSTNTMNTIEPFCMFRIRRFND